MAIDLTHPRIRDCFDSMLEVITEKLPPDEVTTWHDRVANCENLTEAADVTAEMIGKPLTESERRMGEEARNSYILYGGML